MGKVVDYKSRISEWTQGLLNGARPAVERKIPDKLGKQSDSSNAYLIRKGQAGCLLIIDICKEFPINKGDQEAEPSRESCLKIK